MLPELSDSLLTGSTCQAEHFTVMKHALFYFLAVPLLPPPQAVATVNNTVVAPPATIMLQTVQIPPRATVMANIKYNCCVVVAPAVSFLYFSTIKLCLT